MDHLDADLQKRVWQRVQGRTEAKMPPLGPDPLRPGVELIRENAAAYGQLSRYFSGRERELCRQLWQDSQQCLYVLRGLCDLLGERWKPLQPQTQKQPPRRRVEQCFRREQRAAELWQGMTGPEEYRPVYFRLAQGAQDRSVHLLELLGRLGEEKE